MSMKFFAVVLSLLVIMSVAGCHHTSAHGTQIIVVGESHASGAEAAKEANNLIKNAAGKGCHAISVGGYATGGEGLIIGIPVLLDCPPGTIFP
jgi:hypothetical protein